jgi:hypothetical protein
MIGLKYDINTINTKRNLVKQRLYEESEHIKSESFVSISEQDILILYELYDEVFLNNWFADNFRGKIKFKLSRQLTRAAGNTRTKRNIGEILPEDIEFEIKISLDYLYNFNEDGRAKYVGGIQVFSRLDSLMLIFEHELCHVIEFIIRKKSSCKKPPFKELVYDLFGQNESTHKLVSIQEINYLKYGFKPGDSVTFSFQGQEINGRINKIVKNAIVISPCKRGYKKYSVPLSNLMRK